MDLDQCPLATYRVMIYLSNFRLPILDKKGCQGIIGTERLVWGVTLTPDSANLHPGTPKLPPRRHRARKPVVPDNRAATTPPRNPRPQGRSPTVRDLSLISNLTL